MIDNIDRKIILELRNNGRESNVKLSKKLNLSVSTVAKRIERLLSEEIITIKAVINQSKMGYKAHAFIMMDVELPKVNNVCNQLVNHTKVSLLVTTFGRFDVIIVVDFPNWEGLYKFTCTELSQIDGINKIDTFMVSAIKKRYQGIFENSENDIATAKIDEIDQILIEELQINGLINYAKLAEKLKIGLATVSRRITFLLKENIIKIIAVPNPSKIGYITNASIVLDVDIKKMDSVCNELVKQNSVYGVMTLMNGFNILAAVASSSPEMLYKFIAEKIACIDGVSNVETFIRAEILKSNYARLELPIPRSK